MISKACPLPNSKVQCWVCPLPQENRFCSPSPLPASRSTPATRTSSAGGLHLASWSPGSSSSPSRWEAFPARALQCSGQTPQGPQPRGRMQCRTQRTWDSQSWRIVQYWPRETPCRVSKFVTICRYKQEQQEPAIRLRQAIL